VPEAVRQRGGDRDAEERRGHHFLALPPGTDGARPGVPVKPLAQQDGKPSVPAFEKRVEFCTVLAAYAGQNQRR
jgi:hypothetical protein